MKKLILLALIGVPFAFATTDTKDDLIALDKEWGVANLKADKTVLARVYADDLISVGPVGVATKADMLASIEPSDTTDYVTSEYEVKMLGDDTAVMTHKGEGYRSLHVFAKRGAQWQVVATAAIPQSED